MPVGEGYLPFVVVLAGVERGRPRQQVTGESLPADGKLADVDASSTGATSVTVALAFILLVRNLKPISCR